MGTTCSPQAVSRGYVIQLFSSLFHVHQLNLVVQLRVRRDSGRRETGGAVAELGRDGQPTSAAFLHADDPFIPALDNTSIPELEGERRLPVNAAVELLAVFERAGVMHGDGVPRLGFLTSTGLQVDRLKAGHGLDELFLR